jgi:omega-6 fatty acid desaturase (delta-12 desaturase)
VSLLVHYSQSNLRIADFDPKAVIFGEHQWGQIILSDIGVAFWLAAIGYSIHTWGFFEVFRLYLVPYLWYVTFF